MYKYFISRIRIKNSIYSKLLNMYFMYRIRYIWMRGSGISTHYLLIYLFIYSASYWLHTIMIYNKNKRTELGLTYFTLWNNLNLGLWWRKEAKGKLIVAPTPGNYQWSCRLSITHFTDSLLFEIFGEYMKIYSKVFIEDLYWRIKFIVNPTHSRHERERSWTARASSSFL